jgi:7-cyano-7-deazaguanine synthase
MMRAVISLSGGMDSTGLLMRLLADGYSVSCISFNYGQKHVIELDRAMANISYLAENDYFVEHRTVDLSSTMGLFHSALTMGDLVVPEGHYESEQMKQTVVPNRNAIFASILYGYALSVAIREESEVAIALGVHGGDHEIYPDCRPEFYEAVEHAFSVGNWNSELVSFHLPFLDGDKASILIDAQEAVETLGLDFDTVFANTITSYNPDVIGRSSGRSGADVERILAFHAIGRADPIEYVDGWETALGNALTTNEIHEASK